MCNILIYHFPPQDSFTSGILKSREIFFVNIPNLSIMYASILTQNNGVCVSCGDHLLIESNLKQNKLPTNVGDDMWTQLGVSKPY